MLNYIPHSFRCPFRNARALHTLTDSLTYLHAARLTTFLRASDAQSKLSTPSELRSKSGSARQHCAPASTSLFAANVLVDSARRGTFSLTPPRTLLAGACMNPRFVFVLLAVFLF